MTCCPVCGSALGEGPVTLHPARGLVVANGRFQALTGTEMRVLQELALSWPNVVPKTRLMDALYGLQGDEPGDKIIDVFICKLRRKIKPLGVAIHTHWATGYSLGAEGAPRIAETEDRQ